MNTRPNTQEMNTFSLLAKSRKKKVVNLKVYNRFGEEAQSLAIEPDYMGLRGCYINAAELSSKWLNLCKKQRHLGAHYANGKLLIYIGRYNYPVYGIMQPLKVDLKVLRYLHRRIK